MYTHILISTDGSDVARKGLDQGLALAKSLGAKVTIVTVTERMPVYYGLDAGVAAVAYDGYGASQRDAAQKTLAAAKDAAVRLGVTADTVLLENVLPAEAILDAAKTHGCNLIAMASHGRRGLGRLVMGSVTAEVLAHSPVAVLVVR